MRRRRRRRRRREEGKAKLMKERYEWEAPWEKHLGGAVLVQVHGGLRAVRGQDREKLVT